MSFNLTNSNNIIADEILLLSDNQVKKIYDVFVIKSQLDATVGGDSYFFTTIDERIDAKRDIVDSYSKSYLDLEFSKKMSVIVILSLRWIH